MLAVLLCVAQADSQDGGCRFLATRGFGGSSGTKKSSGEAITMDGLNVDVRHCEGRVF